MPVYQCRLPVPAYQLVPVYQRRSTSAGLAVYVRLGSRGRTARCAVSSSATSWLKGTWLDLAQGDSQADWCRFCRDRAVRHLVTAGAESDCATVAPGPARCVGCGGQGRLCPGCRAVRYCADQCQRAHRQVHKAVCAQCVVCGRQMVLRAHWQVLKTAMEALARPATQITRAPSTVYQCRSTSAVYQCRLSVPSTSTVYQYRLAAQSLCWRFFLSKLPK